MSLAHGTSIINDGLMLHLDAANIKSYPGSGNTLIDLSGNKYDHTLVNSVLTTIDNVPCFNTSSNGYIQDLGNTFSYGSSHTLISWARPLADNQVSTWRTLWRTQPNNHPLLIQDATNLIGYYDNGGALFVSYGLNIGSLNLENKWTMFSLVATGSTTTLYINNGSITGSVPYTTVGNSQDAIGSTNNGSQPFGYISNAIVYNRNLSIQEIKYNFEALRGRYGL